jgi:hypothetical protein
MADPFENKQIDKRVVHRYLKKGLVDEKEYERHQKSLPDLAEQAMPIEASIEAEDVEDDGEE